MKQVKTRMKADLSFSRVVGLGDAPPMEEVCVKLAVVSDAPPEKIKGAEALAQQRCPSVYTMRNIARLTPTLEIFKENGADTTVLGTTTVRVTRHAPCPVLTVIRK